MDTRRFNSPAYKRKIRAVRTYKRPAPSKVSEKKWMRALSKIGLGSIIRQVILVLLLAAAIYLIYFAPFLKVYTLVVSGANTEASEQIQNQFSKFRNGYTFIFPERNILFFSKAKFTDYLLKNNLQVQSVLTLNKKWSHTIVLNIQQRLPAYSVQSNNNFYILSTDGKISAQVSDNSLGLPVLVDRSNESINIGIQFLNPNALNFINQINSSISKAASLPYSHYEITSQSSTDLFVYFNGGMRVIFNDSTNAKTYTDRLSNLLSKLTPAQKNNLAYVDLRFDPNAYGCFKNDLCAQGQ